MSREQKERWSPTGPEVDPNTPEPSFKNYFPPTFLVHFKRTEIGSVKECHHAKIPSRVLPNRNHSRVQPSRIVTYDRDERRRYLLPSLQSTLYRRVL